MNILWVIWTIFLALWITGMVGAAVSCGNIAFMFLHTVSACSMFLTIIWMALENIMEK